MTASDMAWRPARKSVLVGTRTVLMPRMWPALSKEGWAAWGTTISGAFASGLWSRAQALAALTATTMLSVPPEVRLPPAPSGADSISRRASRSSVSYLTRLGKRSGAKRALWLMYI